MGVYLRISGRTDRTTASKEDPMADVVVLGAGVAGHTAALHLRRLLPKNNTVTVVTPNSQWNWIPSSIEASGMRPARTSSSSAG